MGARWQLLTDSLTHLYPLNLASSTSPVCPAHETDRAKLLVVQDQQAIRETVAILPGAVRYDPDEKRSNFI